MDDILASIRRIMLDEQARLQEGTPNSPAARPASRPPVAETVLILDSSMAVEGVALPPEQQQDAHRAEAVPMPIQMPLPDMAPPQPAAGDAPMQLATPVAYQEEPAPATVAVTTQTIEALLAPAAAAAAAASVEALLKQLSEERLAILKPAVSNSPTMEDVVRSELRPLLKTWLDEHLPPLVERLVSSEINRLIGRSGL